MVQRRTYRWLLAGVIVAVIGLLTVQIVLMEMAYRAADRAFGQNVNAALQTVAQRLETKEIVTTVLWVGEERVVQGGTPGKGNGTRIMMAVPHGMAMDPSAAGASVRFGADTCPIPPPTVRELREVHVTRTGPAKGNDRVRVTSSGTMAGRELPPGTSADDSVHFTFRFETSGDTLLRQVARGGTVEFGTPATGDRSRPALITRVINRLSGTERKPIQNRVDAAQLDSLLRAEFAANGVTLDHTFGVVRTGEDTLRIAGQGAVPADLLSTPYRTRLFPADILAPPSELLVTFSGARWYLLRQVGPYALATLLFAALIIWGTIHAFLTISRQERLSVHVRDFINNMVHEFKTPLSTITLAAEALVRPDVIGQRTRIRRYVHVIGEEAGRMRVGVSKILQMAVVEEGEYDLALKPVDIHALLDSVTAVFAVQVESRGGVLTMQKDGAPPFVTADTAHLTNILHNVLENAVKYTQETPAIDVRVQPAANTVTIRIADNGIGMAAGETARVFEKYYRVPTGNVHDVKGFGLGLAYVRLMMTAMQGTVALESAPGKGTTVLLTLQRAQEGGA